jgi:hypothetical protein
LADSQTPALYLPFSKNHRFTVRTDELNTLERKLLKEQDSAKAAIVGLGGIGKTLVALSFAYSVREKHLEFSMFWYQPWAWRLSGRRIEGQCFGNSGHCI